MKAKKKLNIIEEVKLLWTDGKKSKGAVNFKFLITFKNGELKAEVTPPDADMEVVKGILGIVFLELQGIKSDEFLKQAKKEAERLKAEQEGTYPYIY